LASLFLTLPLLADLPVNADGVLKAHSRAVFI